MLKPKNANYIDEYIRKNLVELNQKGIHTYWSCSGISQDHSVERQHDELYASAYLCINLATIAPFLEQLARKINEVKYTPEEWYTDFGRFPAGIKALESIQAKYGVRETSRLSPNMWDLEVDCLMNLKDEWDRPCLTIRPHDPAALSRITTEQKDHHMRVRWDRLFELLLSLE